MTSQQQYRIGSMTMNSNGILANGIVITKKIYMDKLPIKSFCFMYHSCSSSRSYINFHSEPLLFQTIHVSRFLNNQPFFPLHFFLFYPNSIENSGHNHFFFRSLGDIVYGFKLDSYRLDNFCRQFGVFNLLFFPFSMITFIVFGFVCKNTNKNN